MEKTFTQPTSQQYQSLLSLKKAGVWRVFVRFSGWIKTKNIEEIAYEGCCDSQPLAENLKACSEFLLENLHHRLYKNANNKYWEGWDGFRGHIQVDLNQSPMKIRLELQVLRSKWLENLPKPDNKALLALETIKEKISKVYLTFWTYKETFRSSEVFYVPFPDKQTVESVINEIMTVGEYIKKVAKYVVHFEKQNIYSGNVFVLNNPTSLQTEIKVSITTWEHFATEEEEIHLCSALEELAIELTH